MREIFPPGLAAYKGLRGAVLLELKHDQPLTAKELAGRHAVSANAIRRYLKGLEAEGLVEYGREQRGPGAPVHAYRLTPGGEALFPRRYDEALTDVLAYVAQTAGREQVRQIFAEWFRALAGRLRPQLSGATLEERVEAVVGVLSGQGFMAEWTPVPDGVRIAEHNCAVQSAAMRFPEICAAEADFLREVLQADIEREAYIPDGCNACAYAVGVSQTPVQSAAAGRPSSEES